MFVTVQNWFRVWVHSLPFSLILRTFNILLNLHFRQYTKEDSVANVVRLVVVARIPPVTWILTPTSLAFVCRLSIIFICLFDTKVFHLFLYTYISFSHIFNLCPWLSQNKCRVSILPQAFCFFLVLSRLDSSFGFCQYTEEATAAHVVRLVVVLSRIPPVSCILRLTSPASV